MSAKAIGLLGAAISKLGGLLRRRRSLSQEVRLRRAVVDVLEERRLLACSISSGIVTCTASGGNDEILVFQVGSPSNDVHIVIPGDGTYDYDIGDVTRVDIFGGAGADIFIIEGNSNPQGQVGTGHVAVTESIVIYGEDDDDTFYGGDGSETMYGGNGVDLFNGHDGSDFAYGEAGNDEFHGGNGNDWMYGGDDDDDLFGDDGTDHLNGGNGADVLRGGNNGDELNGDAGSDDLDGQNGSDSLFGGADGDVLQASDFGTADTVDGGTGSDTLSGHDSGVDTLLNIP